jgi:hypothetical protein
MSKEENRMAVYLKSFLAGAVALALFVLPFFVYFGLLGGVVFRQSTAIAFGVGCLLVFATGFGWEHRRASRLSSR